MAPSPSPSSSSSSTTAAATTTSQGFDLDAIPSNAKDGDVVVYEVGGGASTIERNDHGNNKETPSATRGSSSVSKTSDSHTMIDPRLELPEQCKSRGNQEFVAKNFLDAYDAYTEAIEACPGMSGEEILSMKKKHDELENEKAYARHTQESMRRRKIPEDTKQTLADDENPNHKPSASGEEEKDAIKYIPKEFQLPKQDFAEALSIYYSNRAACSLHLTHYETAIQDCDVALLLNPKYTKALIRRMTAYENLQRTEEALRDANLALTYDPKNKDIQKHVQRLQKLENERLEKLKEETMGKLKDLGNSVLGYFGLSLDNFKADKDPNTGSYNISFQQNK